MTDRCEPPAELRGVDGWHWVQCAIGPNPESYDPELMWWDAAYWLWSETAGGVGQPLTHYIHVAAVLTPTEVAALRAENARLREALAMIANHPEANVVLTDYGPDGKPRVWPTVREEAIAALAKEPEA